MKPLSYCSAKELASLVRRKKVGCLELLDYFVKRIARYNPEINAVIFMDIESARKRAKEADKALAKGNVWGPLHGVPMTVKESYDVVGMPTTWGIPAYKNNFPANNARVVERFLDAGAVLFGKTNVPLNLADWQTFNEIYGTTNNPWDVTRVPGGSSGGAAAALAGGLTGLEAGSDIGASIRNPAHYCGVYGHKPTYGIVSPRGHAILETVSASDIAVVGPLSRGAEDLAIALKVMAGPDDIDDAGWRLRLPKAKKNSFREFNISVVYNDREAEVDDEVQGILRALSGFLRKEKAKVREEARPRIDPRQAYENFIRLRWAATCGRLTPAEFKRDLEFAATFDPDDESYQAQRVRGETLFHRDWLGFNEARHKMRLAWAEFFREYDLLLCPVAATAAFPHNQKGERWERMIRVNGRPQPSTTQLFWAGYSGNFYLPATVAPAGFTSTGLPVGVQIIGPQYGDLTCIEFARLLEREFQGFVPPPGYE
jgi:amidase